VKLHLLERLVGCLALLGPALFAQNYRGQVQGIVTDPTDAAVAGARVTLKNVNTGVEAVQTSNQIGQYVFGYVEPGQYSLTVEAKGFNKFVQENISVLTRGDVTVNARLTVGGVSEQVTVSEAVAAVEFNTSTLATTVNGKTLKELPVLGRSPWSLVMLDPAVVDVYGQRFRHGPASIQANNGFDVGGSTGGKNDMLLDGSPVTLGLGGSYTPNMDATQEVVVQQNSVDAEFGFSAGGILSLSTKSGTNEFHGVASYFGRNPKLNAVANSITRSPNIVRRHVWGANIGGPILKNKLFFFSSYEQVRRSTPKSVARRLPTALEMKGDFSQSKNVVGGLRTIYDPWSTKFDPATGTVTRMPLAGNIIPSSKLDPTGVKVMSDLYLPNNPGIDPMGTNNFQLTLPLEGHYWNFSERFDYIPNERLRINGRYSSYQDRGGFRQYVPTPVIIDWDSGLTDVRGANLEVLYQFNPSTFLDIRLGSNYMENDYTSDWGDIGEQGWAKLWPNGWYKPVLKGLDTVFYPAMSFDGANYIGNTGWWVDHPHNYSYQVTLNKDRGIHHLKAGQTLRMYVEPAALPDPMQFNFSAVDTASTFLNPNTSLSGDPYASLLLGSLNSGYARVRAPWDVHSNQWGAFIQDDVKLTRRITLNLGLRYEYETAPWEETDQFSRYLDLTQPIPEMQGAGAPKMPASVTQIASIPYKFNGAWIFTDPSHRHLYNAQTNVFLPRAGVAIRVNDKTAFRAGFARYAVPQSAARGFTWNIDYYGNERMTPLAPTIEGIPGARLSDPYPASNPLLLPPGKSLGRYTNLGDSAYWVRQDYRTPINDRYNFTLQRQLPFETVVEGTYFLNLGHDVPDPNMWGSRGVAQMLNMVDPRLKYQYKGLLDQGVANPFYQFGSAQTFPGQLRNMETVPASQLLRPYPQYMDLGERYVAGRTERYQAFQLKLRRPFSRGLTWQLGYNYHRHSRDIWFNDIDQYDNKWTRVDAMSGVMGGGEPRHQLTFSGVYDVPFGKGRAWGAHVHPVLNGIAGGWTLSGVYFWNSGPYLVFPQAEVTGDPRTQNQTWDHWFNTAAFKLPQPYTPRTNPYMYDGLTGPGFWSLDGTLAKFFPVTERFQLEFRMEAYNVTNSFVPSQPDTNVGSPTFGRITWQSSMGREFQYSIRLHF